MAKAFHKLFIYSAITSAVIVGPSAIAGDMIINSFVRAGAAINSGDTPYLERIDKNGNTGDTHFGMNVARDLGNGLSAAGQVFASGAEGGGFEVVLDWAYITQRVSPQIKISAGKIKYPNLIVSDYVDIGIAYPWARPPQELYSFDVEGRPNISLEAFTGGSAIYEGFASDYEYSLQVYGGEAGLEGGGTLSKMMGGKLKFGDEMFALHAGYNRHMPEGTIGEGGAAAMKNGNDVGVMSVGATVNVANALIMAEYANATVSDEEDLDTSAYYATVGYQIGKIMPHITYAKLDAEEGRSSVTVGARYQLSDASTIKFEIQNVSPDEEASEGEESSEEAESFNVFTATWDIVF